MSGYNAWNESVRHYMCIYEEALVGTNSLVLLLSVQVLEGRSYRLVQPWIGVVNRSQQDINKNVDMIAARRREREYFQTNPDYGHLASKMGSEYLGKVLSKVQSLVPDE